MRTHRVRSGLLALAVCLPTLQGCTFLYKTYLYANDRVRDTVDMVDIGLTLSPKPNFSAYACGLGLFTAGGGYVDGYYAGIGSGRVGAFRHYHKTVGLLAYSYEEFGWVKFDINDKKTLSRRHVGPIGYLFFKNDEACVGPS